MTCTNAPQLTAGGSALMSLTRGQRVKCKGDSELKTFVIGGSMLGEGDTLYSYVVLVPQECTRSHPRVSTTEASEVSPKIVPLHVVVEIEPRDSDLDHESWKTM